MPDLKLARLPDRTPVKLTISILPELQRRLSDYAAVYGRIYGVQEPVSELIPAMLNAFLESDREFIKAMRGARGGSE